jgi:TonB family protein
MSKNFIALLAFVVVGCDVHSKDQTRLVSRIPVPKPAEEAKSKSQLSRAADGGSIVMPVPVKRVEPVFPESPRIQVPFIVVEAVVTKHGDVANVKVVEGGDNMYTRAVVDALKQWKFRPGTVDGKPADMSYQLKANINVR